MAPYASIATPFGFDSTGAEADSIPNAGTVVATYAVDRHGRFTR
jgi:hypothetical protein